VLEVTTPWQLKLKHKGKEYEVAIGQKPNDSLFRPLTSVTTPSGVTVAPAGAAAPPAPDAAAPTAGGLRATPAVPPSAASAPPVPAPIGTEALRKMDSAAARAALSAVSAARERADLNGETAARLEQEEQALVRRLEELNR
jgi:hypothetical protein